MRIDNELKLSGYFWLPSKSEKKIAGTLSIKNGGEIELEIIGHFTDDEVSIINEPPEISRVVGLVEKLNLVTLESCFYSKPTFSFGGISKSHIHVNHLFSGIEYEQNEKILFDSFNFSIDGLEEWIGISGISVNYNSDFLGAKVEFKQPSNLSYKLKDGLFLEIKFGHSMPVHEHPINLELSQNTYFKITSEHVLDINDVISYTHKFVTFLNFAIDANVSLKNIYCFSNSITRDVNGATRPEPIGLYYSSIPFEENAPKTDWNSMLFRFADVKDRFNLIMNKWLGAYEVISPSLNLYFSTKTGAQKYLDGKFLALAQAIETYHRRTSTETYTSKEKFKSLIKGIKTNCPDEHKKWLATRIDMGNEISLRDRLNRIIEPFKSRIGTDKDVELIVKLIVDTRNYLTHFDPKLEKKAAYGQNLWCLCQKMEAILQLHLLKELDFNDIEIGAVLSKTYKFKNKLNNTKISITN